LLRAPIFGLTIEEETTKRQSSSRGKNNAKSVFSDDTINKVNKNVVKEQNFTDKSDFKSDYKVDFNVDRINTFTSSSTGRNRMNTPSTRTG
jgi:hypothetical protein